MWRLLLLPRLGRIMKFTQHGSAGALSLSRRRKFLLRDL